MLDDPIISVRGLVTRFGKHTVHDGLDLDVQRGEIIGIVGGSGTGKSVLLHAVVGLLKPAAGQITVFGENVRDTGADDYRRLRKRWGVMFQGGSLFSTLTVAENVQVPLREFYPDLGQKLMDEIAAYKVLMAGLPANAGLKYPAELSGGMKKRAGLARALALDPRILFYDEPSAGLDPVTSAEIDQLMLDLTRKLGVTSVVVTHEMDSAFTIADRMVMLDKGRVLKIDTRDAFDAIRTVADDATEGMTVDDLLIRQFLRGDPIGPITQRREDTNYAEDLLNTADPQITRSPAVQATRRSG